MQSSNKNNDKISVEKIVPLKENESKYIKPLRLHYNLNGKSLTWDCMKAHDSVAILLFNSTRNKLVFVRQFRPAVYLATHCSSPESIDTILSDQSLEKKPNVGFTLELCAGIVDKEGKTMEEIAIEEILEETGYDAPLSSLKFISSFRSGVGILGSLQHLYYCQVSDEIRVNKGGGIGDEQIEVIELTIEETKQLMYCEDSEAIMSRTAGLLFGLSWFIYEHLPTLKL